MAEWDNVIKTVTGARIALIGLFVLAIGYTLFFMADLLVPIAFAILLNVLLSPIVRRMERWGIGPRIGAGAVMLTIIGIAALAIIMLAEPAERWLAEAPTTVRELRSQTLEAQGKLADIQELAEEVEEITDVESPSRPRSVVVEGPGFLEDLLGGLPSIVAGTVVIVFLTYFLLASGDTVLRRLTRCARTWAGRRRIVSIVREIQSDLSSYLGTVTIINLSLGGVVALALYWLEVPNPVLWGTMVAALNFAPYVGSMVAVLIMAVVGLTNSETIADGLVVPGVVLLLTTLEGQLLTPMLLGRRVSLNPTVVFLAVIVWGWLWGVAGALMAVPITTSLKIVFDHIPSSRYLATFMQPNDDCGRRSVANLQRKSLTLANLFPKGEQA